MGMYERKIEWKNDLRVDILGFDKDILRKVKG
jgi:hypothetical protein